MDNLGPRLVSMDTQLRQPDDLFVWPSQGRPQPALSSMAWVSRCIESFRGLLLLEYRILRRSLPILGKRYLSCPHGHTVVMCPKPRLHTYLGTHNWDLFDLSTTGSV